MKKANLILWMALWGAFVSCSHRIPSDQVPQAVRIAFEKEYPKAGDIEWEKEKSGEYEVSFELGEDELTVVYDELGRASEVEKEIEPSQLPEAVKTVLAGKRIREAAEITRNGRLFYEAEVGGKDLFYDASGKQLSDIK